MDLDLSKVHPDCREFVGTVEELLERRQREPEAMSVSDKLWREDYWGPRKWHRTELEDMVYSSYKQMRQGRINRPPRRDKALEIASYLNCTIDERNSLLLAADAAPVPPYLTGEQLEECLAVAIGVAEQLGLPAMVLNRDWRIHYSNQEILDLFDLTLEQAAEISPERNNLLRLLFDPELPLYPKLAENRPSWTRMVRQTIYSFKRANVFCQYENWYIEMLREFMMLPEFAEHWRSVRADAPFDADPSADAPPTAAFDGSILPMLRVHSRRDWLRPLVINVGYFQFDFPIILVFLPTDYQPQTD